MTAIQLVVTLGVALLTVTLNALVNVRLRFAPDRATADRELKTLALRLGYRVLLTLNVAGFLWNAFRAAPLDRASAFVLVVQGCTLTMTPLVHMLRRLAEMQLAAAAVQSEHLAHTGRILDALETKKQRVAPPQDPNGPAA